MRYAARQELSFSGISNITRDRAMAHLIHKYKPKPSYQPRLFHFSAQLINCATMYMHVVRSFEVIIRRKDLQFLMFVLLRYFTYR